MKSFLIVDAWGDQKIISKGTIFEVFEECKEKCFEPLMIINLPLMCSGCET